MIDVRKRVLLTTDWSRMAREFLPKSMLLTEAHGPTGPPFPHDVGPGCSASPHCTGAGAGGACSSSEAGSSRSLARRRSPFISVGSSLGYRWRSAAVNPAGSGFEPLMRTSAQDH